MNVVHFKLQKIIGDFRMKYTWIYRVFWRVLAMFFRSVCFRPIPLDWNRIVWILMNASKIEPFMLRKHTKLISFHSFNLLISGRVDTAPIFTSLLSDTRLRHLAPYFRSNFAHNLNKFRIIMFLNSLKYLHCDPHVFTRGRVCRLVLYIASNSRSNNEFSHTTPPNPLTGPLNIILKSYANSNFEIPIPEYASMCWKELFCEKVLRVVEYKWNTFVNRYGRVWWECGAVENEIMKVWRGRSGKYTEINCKSFPRCWGIFHIFPMRNSQPSPTPYFSTPWKSPLRPPTLINITFWSWLTRLSTNFRRPFFWNKTKLTIQ